MTEWRTTDDLLPCPFCTLHKWVQVENHDPDMKPEISCSNCGATMQGETLEDAIHNWNQREPDRRKA